MNLPNKLTLSRIALVPVFVILLHIHEVTSDRFTVATFRWLALAVFVLAAITDYLDGAIARKHNIVTDFGKLFDPLADKLLTMAAFVSFVELRGPDNLPIFPAWAIIVILAREFLVTGLRSVALTNGKVVHADNWGKQKTIWQLIGIIAVLTTIAVRETVLHNGWDFTWYDSITPWIFRSILAVIVILTAGSGLAFLIKNWSVVGGRN